MGAGQADGDRRVAGRRMQNGPDRLIAVRVQRKILHHDAHLPRVRRGVLGQNRLVQEVRLTAGRTLVVVELDDDDFGAFRGQDDRYPLGRRQEPLELRSLVARRLRQIGGRGDHRLPGEEGHARHRPSEPGQRESERNRTRKEHFHILNGTFWERHHGQGRSRA